MNHGSLFSGIGGFDLAAEWMGWNNVFHCEINPFGRKVLKYYWPNAISYDDITTTDFTIHRGNIDILTGGFPCQPFSVAGKRKGTEDHRNLWPEYHRAIKEIQPTWVVGENVPGLINWSKGLVFEQVQADLENEGYEVWPVILPACSVDAPHRRERVWFVAYAESNRNRGKLYRMERENDSKWKSKKHGENNLQFRNNGEKRNVTNPASNRRGGKREEFEIEKGLQQKPGKTRELEGRFEGFCNQWNAANTNSQRQQKCNNAEKSTTQKQQFNKAILPHENWQNFPTQPPVCSGNDGISSKLDGITFPKWRNESIKAYGNAIVPQVVYQIFKAIDQFEKTS